MSVAFYAGNFPMNTTAAPVAVTTGTAIKTMLQIATPATGSGLNVVEWGISFDGSVAATPIKVELIDTNVAATTGTAHVSAGLQPYTRDSLNNISTMQLGAALTAYTMTVEGTPTATRYGDVQFIAPTSQYVKQYPLGREFEVGPARFLRVRVTAAAAVNAYCYVIWEE